MYKRGFKFLFCNFNEFRISTKDAAYVVVRIIDGCAKLTLAMETSVIFILGHQYLSPRLVLLQIHRLFDISLPTPLFPISALPSLLLN